MKRARRLKVRKVELPGKVMYDVVACYKGGLSRALDRQLTKVARRESAGSGMMMYGTFERDIQWQCDSLEQAARLLIAFAGFAARHVLKPRTSRLRFELRRTETAWVPCPDCNGPVLDYLFNDKPRGRGAHRMLCFRCSLARREKSKLATKKRHYRRRKRRVSK